MRSKKRVPPMMRVGDALLGEHALQGLGLGIHPVEHSEVRELPALGHPVQNGLGDAVGLVLLVFRQVQADFRPWPGGGPKGLAFALLVVGDDGIGGVQDVLSGAVVLLPAHPLGPGEVLLEMQNVLDGGPPELVDALVVVAHHAQVAAALGQQTDKPVLGVVGVLVLVHHQVAETVLVVLQHVGAGLEQAHGVDDEVVKVHGVGIGQAALVDPVGLGHLLQAEVVPGAGLEVLRRGELVLGPGDFRQGAPHRQGPLGDIQILEDVLHQAAAVVGVVDGEVGGVPQPVPIPAEDACAAGVEGGGPHLVAALAQHLAQAGLQLPGSLVCKGDSHYTPGRAGGHAKPGTDNVWQLAVKEVAFTQFDILWGEVLAHQRAVVGLAIADDVGNAVDQHGGLAAAGAGQHQEGAFGGEDGLLLAGVHAGEVPLHHLAAQGKQFLVGHGCHGTFLW